MSCEAENKETFGIFFLQSVTTVSCVAIRMNKISLMVRKKKRRVPNLLEGFAVTDDDVGPETLRSDVLLQPAAQVLDGRL